MGTAEICGSAGHGGGIAKPYSRLRRRARLPAAAVGGDPARGDEQPVRRAARGCARLRHPETLPVGLEFVLKGAKAPHCTGDSMPAETVGHFGMAGTYLRVVPAWLNHTRAGTAMAALTDRELGEWAKPLWQGTNTALFDAL